MKIKHILPFFLILIGCEETIDKPTSSEDQVKELVAEKGSSFEDFLITFSKDTNFQQDHQEDTLLFQYYDGTEEGGFVTEKVDYGIHFDLTYHDSFASQKVDAYMQEIKQYEDSVVISQKGVDNGIRVDFVFIPKDTTWVLHKWVDYSY